MSICLIAEADPFIARLLTRYADACSLTSVRACTGEETVTLAQRLQPAVAIVDIGLPGEVPGWNTVAALREGERTARIPIITCSWLDEVETRELAGPAGGHLRIPDVPFSAFLSALEAVHVPIEVRHRMTQATEAPRGEE